MELERENGSDLGKKEGRGAKERRKLSWNSKRRRKRWARRETRRQEEANRGGGGGGGVCGCWRKTGEREWPLLCRV